MAIRIEHPEHGFHNVYSQIDLEDHIKMGWNKVVEKQVEPVKGIEETLKDATPAVLPPTYPCEVCGKVFKMKMHLGAHKRKHKRE